MQSVYFDGSSDRPLRIDLLQGTSDPEQDLDEWPAARSSDASHLQAHGAGKGRPREHASGPWVVLEVLVATVLAALAAPVILLHQREMVVTLFLQAFLTPLVRHTRYAALLHLASLTALLLHLRGHSDVTVVFCTAMLLVYADAFVQQPRARRSQAQASYCAVAVLQVAISVLVSNETLRIVNVCATALVAMHFASHRALAG